MKLCLLLVFILLNIASLEGNRNNQVINRIIKLLKRRNAGHRNIFGAPTYPEDLPSAEPLMPGHTLIRPSLKMLKSSIKYPQRDLKMAVYGNLDNLGITYDKTPYRVLYTGFRRSGDNIQSTIVRAIENIIESKDDPSDTNVILIEANFLDKETNMLPVVSSAFDDDEESSSENDARELITDTSSEEKWQSRRSHRYESKKKRVKYRDRYNLYSSNSSSSSSESSTDTSESSDYEKNPGNPYTLYKEKYKQNWLWNHFMDGDHMNVNPFAPKLNKLGPSGAELFFGRKWWYFNQDDYKPLK